MRFLEAILDTSSDRIFVRDSDGRHLYANPASEEWVVPERGGTLGKTVFDLFEPETAEQMDREDREVMATGRAITYERRIRTQTGDEQTGLVTKYPYRAPDGTILGVVGVSRDVTETRRLEGQLQRQLEQLRELDRLKASFVSPESS